jgi:hypothetical protein
MSTFRNVSLEKNTLLSTKQASFKQGAFPIGEARGNRVAQMPACQIWHTTNG